MNSEDKAANRTFLNTPDRACVITGFPTPSSGPQKQSPLELWPLAHPGTALGRSSAWLGLANGGFQAMGSPLGYNQRHVTSGKVQGTHSTCCENGQVQKDASRRSVLWSTRGWGGGAAGRKGVLESTLRALGTPRSGLVSCTQESGKWAPGRAYYTRQVAIVFMWAQIMQLFQSLKILSVSLEGDLCLSEALLPKELVSVLLFPFLSQGS